MDPGLNIILLGNSGVGKSASGNSILGRAAFESRRAFRPVTTQISEPIQTTRFGKQISVVDTPGILGSEREIRTRCRELLKSSGPCLFLVVVKVDRFTVEQKNAVEAALRVIGHQQLYSCYLLFTGGDDLADTSLDDFINEDPEGPLKPVVERFEGRCHLFNNKNGGQDQVRQLLEKSGHLSDAGHPRTVRRIVLLGLPGDGKSSSGNTILGSQKFTSDCSFNPVTTETVSGSAPVEGRWVTVVDTPGFTGKVLRPKKLYLEIMKLIKEASPGPHAFLIVVKIDRISEAEVKLFRMLPKLFGRDVDKYVMVLFTHGDKLKDQSVGDLCNDNTYVKNLVEKCGGRTCVFDNTNTGNRLQVSELLNEIDKMVSANGGVHYTSETFRKAQTGMVNLSILWDEIREDFIRLLRELDCRHCGYERLD